MEKALDETLEDAEFLQVDGINDSAFERPGKIEVVTDEEEEEEDGGGWVLVQAQLKSWEGKATEGVESRTGRFERLYPTLSAKAPSGA